MLWAQKAKQMLATKMGFFAFLSNFSTSDKRKTFCEYGDVHKLRKLLKVCQILYITDSIRIKKLVRT